MHSQLRDVLSETIRQWTRDRAPQLAASLSFYTLFSLAPLVLIAIAVAGSIFGEEAARERLMAEIAQATGPRAAEAIGSLVESAGEGQSGALPAFIGAAMLLMGASAGFLQLKQALNIIWNVEPKPEEKGKGGGLLAAVWTWVRARFLGIALVLGAGALLVASLVASSLLSAVVAFLESVTPLQIAALQAGDVLVSLTLVTLIFALIFKFLPDVKIRWRDVWVGAIVTSALFNLGKFAISLYLGQSAVTSTYGAAGSLVVILLWVYYSCQILFFGAELTQVLSDRGKKRAEEKAAKPAPTVVA